jgi:hypothetical protein
VYASAAARTKRWRLAWLVQAKFRGPRRFCSAVCEAVAPETVRRTRRGPYALVRPADPGDGSPAADQARCDGKGGNGRAPGAIRVPQPQRSPGVLTGTGDVAAAVPASCPRRATAGERPD